MGPGVQDREVREPNQAVEAAAGIRHLHPEQSVLHSQLWRTVPEWGTHRDQLCGIDSESVGEQADGEAATNAMDGKRGALIAANADQSVEWGVGGDVPALVPKVSTRNGGNAAGTQAGRVTPWFLVLSIDDPKVGLQASLCMEAIGGLPEFLQHVHQIQDQGDVEFLVDSNLERTFPIRQGQTSHGSQGIAAVHLFRHLLDHSGLTLEQTRPYPLVFRTWGRRSFTGCWAGSGKKAFDDLL